MEEWKGSLVPSINLLPSNGFPWTCASNFAGARPKRPTARWVVAARGHMIWCMSCKPSLSLHAPIPPTSPFSFSCLIPIFSPALAADFLGKSQGAGLEL